MRAADGDAILDAAQAAAADAGTKGMIPFGRPSGSGQGRPFLDHVLHSLADAGVHDAALVLGPEHDAVRGYYRGLRTSRMRIAFVTQHEPLGTADAVAAAEGWSAGEPFLALNSDNLYPVDVLSRLVAAAGPAVPGFEPDSLGLSRERLGHFALMEADARGCLARIVEKPGAAAIGTAGPGATISMNVWRFDARIFQACRDVPVSERGERELPQAVGLAASRGVCFDVMPARGPVLDLSSRQDVAAVRRALEGAQVSL